VAFIFWEYKPDGGSFEQGLAQARQDLISAVRHLAAIGIDNIPLFAIVTDGLRGVCLAGWGKPDPDTQDVRVSVFELFLYPDAASLVVPCRCLYCGLQLPHI